MSEADRIREEYRRRAREVPPDRYAPTTPANLFLVQQRARQLVRLLARERLLPLGGKRVLEVGCGSCGWLPMLEDFGATRGDLAGIDLDPTRAAAAARRLCGHRDEAGRLLAAGADIRCGDATALPWADGAFDLVVQSTVLTSVLDPGMKRALAAEMVRVLRPGGAVVWYDFAYSNPANANVRGIGRREIAALFPGCRPSLSRVTLAPPVARRLVPYTWVGAAALEALWVLNTHYLGIIRTPGG